MKSATKTVVVFAYVLCVVSLTNWERCVSAGVKVQSEVPKPAEPPPKMVVFADNMSSSPYTPSGWMGNQAAIRVDEKCAVNPHEGGTCMKVEYTAPDQWGGVVWQHPPNDWGDAPGGYNLSGASNLTFWARGETGGEKVKFVLGVIKREKRYFDSANAELEIELTTEWTPYSISLIGKDLTRMKTGFGWTLTGQGKPVTFYVDDVKYE